MMDHILDQTPLVPRSRTPSMSFALPSPMTTMDGPPLESSTLGSPPMNEGERKRRNSRLGSMSGGTTPSVSSPLGLSTVSDGNGANGQVVQEERSLTGRRVLDAEALAASLPPQLAALRAGVPGRVPTPPSSATNAARRISSPNVPIMKPSDSASSSANASPRNSFSYGQGTNGQADLDASTPSTRNQAAKRLSMMALTPSTNGNGNALGRLSMDESAIASDGEQTGSPVEQAPIARRGSASSFTMQQREPAILSHDSKCSGYFVEPVSRPAADTIRYHNAYDTRAPTANLDGAVPGER